MGRNVLTILVLQSIQYSTVHAVISAVYSTDTFWIYLIYYSILFPLCKSHFFKLVSYGIAQCSCSGSEFSARAPCDLGYTCNWGRTQDHFHGLGVQESYFFRRYNMHSTKILYSFSDFQPVGYFWKIQDHWFVPSEEIVLSVSVSHRRWIKTEEKAKVVASVGGEGCVALDDLNYRMNSFYSSKSSQAKQLARLGIE